MLQRIADFMSLQRWWVYFLAIASVGLFGVAERFLSPWDGVYDSLGEPLSGDFSTFYVAGNLVRSGEAADIYDRQQLIAVHAELIGPDPHNGVGSYFLNPPPFAVLVAPFSLVGYSAAALLWAALSFALLGVCAHMTARELFPSASRTKLFAVVCLFMPMQIALGLGQNTPLMLTILSLAYFALRKKRSWTAGLWVGCLVLKPQLALGFALILIGAGRWRAVGGALLSASAIIALSFVFAADAWAPFVASIAESSDYVRGLSGEFPVHMSTSVPGAIDLLLQPIAQVLPTLLGGVFLLCVCVFTIRRWSQISWAPGTRTWDLSVAATLALAWLCSPHLLLYDVALFLLPAAIVGRWTWRRGRPFGGDAFSALTFITLFVTSLWVPLVLARYHSFLLSADWPIVLPQLVTVVLLFWTFGIWHAAAHDEPALTAGTPPKTTASQV